MSHLRSQLIAAFVLATLVPVGVTVWLAAVLIDRSLDYSTVEDLDRLSRTLEATGRQFYQLERDALRRDADAGGVAATRHETASLAAWPASVRGFWESNETERFGLAGEGGGSLELMRRTGTGVDVFRRELGGIRMDHLAVELRETRERVGAARGRDLRRGLTLTLLLLIAAAWTLSLIPIVFLAHRISRPMRQLTAGLTDFASGDWDRRLQPGRGDEVGRAVEAFNRMADQLRTNRDRLVYLTQMSSWQLLARKTAHELKNSLTPIRLTVEEMLARHPTADRAFMAQATQIVVSEIEALERRVRAFSEFAAEPPVRPEPVDVDTIVAERVALLRTGHPGTSYEAIPGAHVRAFATPDLVKGTLTNLIENAAQAAGASGTVRIATSVEASCVVVEIHDSGPGLSPEAAATLFEPTITFKKDGMGLGLLIARKNALLCGGDVTLVPGALGGAGFRVMLPREMNEGDSA